MNILKNKNSKIAFGILIGISLTTVLWRLTYPLGSVSLLVLLPLGILTVLGGYKTSLIWRQATLGVVLTESTPLRKILTGKTISLIHALLLGLGGVFMVAYKGVAAEGWEVTVAILAILSTGYTFPKMIQKLEPHVNQAYLLTAAAQSTTAVVGSAFFVIYVFSLWGIQSHPASLLDASILTAINNSLSELPQGRGITAAFVEIAVSIETLKSWIVVNSTQAFPVIMTISLVYGAVFGFLQVRVITSIVCAVWQIRESGRVQEWFLWRKKAARV